MRPMKKVTVHFTDGREAAVQTFVFAKASEAKKFVRVALTFDDVGEVETVDHELKFDTLQTALKEMLTA